MVTSVIQMRFDVGTESAELWCNPLSLSKQYILDFLYCKSLQTTILNLTTIGVENTVGKGEIACCEQFLFSLQCFQKSFNNDTQKTRVCLGKGYHTILTLITPKEKEHWKHLGTRAANCCKIRPSYPKL